MNTTTMAINFLYNNSCNTVAVPSSDNWSNAGVERILSLPSKQTDYAMYPCSVISCPLWKFKPYRKEHWCISWIEFDDMQVEVNPV